MQALNIFYQLISLVQLGHISAQSHTCCAQYVLLTQSIVCVIHEHTWKEKGLYTYSLYHTELCCGCVCVSSAKWVYTELRY